MLQFLCRKKVFPEILNFGLSVSYLRLKLVQFVRSLIQDNILLPIFRNELSLELSKHSVFGL